MNIRDRNKLLQSMRDLFAMGWTAEALIVDTAAQILGGDEAAILQAQRVYDQHFKIASAN